MANAVQVATDKAGIISQDPLEVYLDTSGVAGVVSAEVLGISKGANMEPGGAGSPSSTVYPIMGIAGVRIETDLSFVSPEDSVGVSSRLHPVSYSNVSYRNESPFRPVDTASTQTKPKKKRPSKK